MEAPNALDVHGETHYLTLNPPGNDWRSQPETTRRVIAEWAQTEWPDVAEVIRSALEQAWDAGYTSGHSKAMRKMSDEPNVTPSVNPYKKEL